MKSVHSSRQWFRSEASQFRPPWIQGALSRETEWESGCRLSLGGGGGGTAANLQEITLLAIGGMLSVAKRNPVIQEQWIKKRKSDWLSRCRVYSRIIGKSSWSQIITGADLEIVPLDNTFLSSRYLGR